MVAPDAPMVSLPAPVIFPATLLPLMVSAPLLTMVVPDGSAPAEDAEKQSVTIESGEPSHSGGD